MLDNNKNRISVEELRIEMKKKKILQEAENLIQKWHDSGKTREDILNEFESFLNSPNDENQTKEGSEAS